MSRPPFPTQRRAISAADRATGTRDRLRSCNVRHEGGILSDEVEASTLATPAGELNTDELTVAILTSKVVQLW
jgi:hypothetical protein